MKSCHNVDVLVVGGGPAGLALSLTLVKEGFSVTVLERSFYKDLRVGETVPPDIKPLLRELGLWQRLSMSSHLPYESICSYWGSPTPQIHDFLLNPYGSGWYLDRNRFDGELAAAAEESGATINRGFHLEALYLANTTWEVSACRGKQQINFKAKYLVDATGRNAIVARRLGLKIFSYDKLIGVLGYFTAPEWHTEESLLLESTTNGWWYSTPLPGKKVVVGFMSDTDLLNKESHAHRYFLNQTMKSIPHMQQRLNGCQWKMGKIKTAHTSLTERPKPDSTFLAIGDAALAFDPLSSQGIIKALRSGFHGARAILSHHKGKINALTMEFQKNITEMKEYLHLRQEYYAMETRWTNYPFWQRRHVLPGIFS